MIIRPRLLGERKLLAHHSGLVGDLEALLEDRDRLRRAAAEAECLAEIEQRVGVVEIARAGRERLTACWSTGIASS